MSLRHAWVVLRGVRQRFVGDGAVILLDLDVGVMGRPIRRVQGKRAVDDEGRYAVFALHNLGAGAFVGTSQPPDLPGQGLMFAGVVPQRAAPAGWDAQHL